MNENINTTATQLAIDNAYYDNKSQECFELISQLNEWVDTDPCQVTFSIAVNERPITSLPVPLAAWGTILTAIAGLYAFYKSRAVQARSDLIRLKTVIDGPMPF